MLKKMISVLLCAGMVLPCAAFADEEKQEDFVTVSVACPEGEKYFEENWQTFEAMCLRYKDDKTPIAFSEYCDGYMFAKIPAEDQKREVEMFLSEPLVFKDETEEDSYRYYAMKQLSRTGVFKGDENGNANPDQNVTRAEAVAMIMRALDPKLGNAADTGFVDVPEDAWYLTAVSAAKKYNMVKGDDETHFSPDRNVTREEFAVMAARALWKMGFLRENTAATVDDFKYAHNVSDKADISPWAISAYVSIENALIRDYIFSEKLGESEENTERFFPKKDATRGETATMLNDVIRFYQIYPKRMATAFGFDKKMPVIDGSTSTYPFTEAIYYRLFSNGDQHPDRPQKHSKSHASYERLIKGEVDALIASVYPASDILELAKENNVELELVPIAYDAMVFFTNKENPAKGLTKEQITDIYVNNAYENWKDLGGSDALLYPYARNYDSGSHAQMERHFLGGKDINEKIRKETTSEAMQSVLTDVMGAQTKDPVGYGLGYSIYYYFKNMDAFYETGTYLKLLAIDGVYPDDETIASGDYPLSNNTYVVIRADSPKDSPARKFAEFMLTDVGQQCVADAGFGPLKK